MTMSLHPRTRLVRQMDGVRASNAFMKFGLKHRTEIETRLHVLAKSVGWGWLGYHAFFAGSKLSKFVPKLIGLRDGILYMEWLPQPRRQLAPADLRQRRVEQAALYVAARVNELDLPQTRSSPSQQLRKHENGARLLHKVLQRAYGPVLGYGFVGRRLSRQLNRLPCPTPTLIDGRMASDEWVLAPHGPLKVDYEHHGMGKNELNWPDPAYDLAEAMLDMEMSREEEEKASASVFGELRGQGSRTENIYKQAACGFVDDAVRTERISFRRQCGQAQKKYHQQFMRAWDFLTVQTARVCGERYTPLRDQIWHPPIVVLDIDGVLDRRLFGFPCTT